MGTGEIKCRDLRLANYLNIEWNPLLEIRIMLLLPFSLKDFQCQYLFAPLLRLLAHAKNTGNFSSSPTKIHLFD